MPLLILDTCAVLDIVRSPLRKRGDHTHLDAVLTILGELECTPAQLQVVIPSIVSEEFERNFEGVRTETERLLADLFSDYAHAVATASLLLDHSLPQLPDTKKLNLTERCGRLIQRFLDRAILEATTDSDGSLAYRRALNRQAPARQGKDSLADCVVTEVALRLARMRTRSGDSNSVIFLSSNTADYCDGRQLKPALQSEFDVAGITYCRNWIEARYACVPVPVRGHVDVGRE